MKFALLPLLVVVAVTGCSRQSPAPQPASEARQSSKESDYRIPAGLAWRGDDMLTMQFVDALQAALHSSLRFDFAPRKPGDEQLLLEIPSNLYWQQVKGSTHFQYVVILTHQPDGKYLGASIGSCWQAQEDIAGCVQTVLSEAADAWGRREGRNKEKGVVTGLHPPIDPALPRRSE